MKGTEVKAAPYETILEQVDPDADVVYMDPPYQGTSTSPDRRYIASLQRLDFEAELRRLVQRDVRFLVSYDAVTTDKKYGEALSADLGLTHLHVAAGPSSQATLLGRSQRSIESLYLSPRLSREIDFAPRVAGTLF